MKLTLTLTTDTNSDHYYDDIRDMQNVLLLNKTLAAIGEIHGIMRKYRKFPDYYAQMTARELFDDLDKQIIDILDDVKHEPLS